MKLVAKRLNPLLRKVRRAEHAEAPNLRPIEELAGDEASLDRLSDANVIGDEQTYGLQAQCHEQGHELVGARLHAQARE
jgi:hypothetical protein